MADNQEKVTDIEAGLTESYSKVEHYIMTNKNVFFITAIMIL